MNFNIKYIFTNGTTKCHSASSEDENLLILSREFPSGVTAVEIHSEDFTASARDIGYFVIPNVKDENLENNGHAALTLFRERPDIETVFPDNVMPIYGICRDNFAILAIL